MLDDQRRVTGSGLFTSPPCTSACPAVMHLHCLGWPWLWGAFKQWEVCCRKAQPAQLIFLFFHQQRWTQGACGTWGISTWLFTNCVVDHQTRRECHPWKGTLMTLMQSYPTPVIAGMRGEGVYHPLVCIERVNSCPVKLSDCEEASQNLSCCSQGFIYY